ncbi:MAG TPA: (2Fe-2S)-binding protein [Candidatus Acidoferrum sp.]|nr:(2Fe-2S)-binding protein [Candidatus Acidoferrum sp.]
MANINELHVNGRVMRVIVDEERTLLSVLRDDLDLTGSKYGCGEGECGACTVLIDGAPVRSCQRRVGTLAGKKVVTIESLASNGKLHPVQQAFVEADAFQCAYCTPGMIMSAVALLNRNKKPTEAEIVRGMEGNICRCGTYGRIVTAISKAAQQLQEAK